MDHGSYILKDAVTVPPGAKIVGECWAELVADGPNFEDDRNPRALFRVGAPGSEGSVEIQDLLFTSRGPTAGLVAVEWNIIADRKGSAAMWDSHVRLGGAIGTQLTSYNCLPSRSSTNARCSAGSLMLHIIPKASAYLDTVWLWVADHDIDDPDRHDDSNAMAQSSIYVARGMLVESKDPTWLYGTSSEHATLYQYQFYRSKNVVAGMIQSESPYYQPTPKPPAPFEDSLGKFPGDPPRCDNEISIGCDASWALRVLDLSDISIYGAGLYSWFRTYTQSCVGTQNCQNRLVELQNNHGNVRIYNLITIGAVSVITSDNGREDFALENEMFGFYPYWSQITVFDPITASGCVLGVSDLDLPPTPKGEGNHLSEVDNPDSYITLVNWSPYEWVKICADVSLELATKHRSG